jgi:hypothetical protein
VKAVTGSAGAVTASALEFDEDPNGSTNAAATSANAAKGRRMRRAVKGVSFHEGWWRTLSKNALRHFFVSVSSLIQAPGRPNH